MHRTTLKRHSGQVLIIVAFALPLLIAVLGLVVDSMRGYSVRLKLNASADAGALAAARAIALSDDAAESAAQEFFYANYPGNYLGSTPEFLGASVIYDEAGDATIEVTARARMSPWFLGVFNNRQMTVSSLSSATRRAVDIAVVVDNTTSLRLGVLGDVTDDVVSRSKEFVSKFQENFDRLALIKFAFGAEVSVPFSADRGFNLATVQSEIDNFDFGSISNPYYTNSAEGFWNALNALKNVPNPSSLQVIVFFTDGAPNSVSSSWDIVSEPTDFSGTIRTGPGADGTPLGLFKHTVIPPENVAGAPSGSQISGSLEALPSFYNPCDNTAVDSGGFCRDPHTTLFGLAPVGGDCGCPVQDDFHVLNPFPPAAPALPRRIVEQYDYAIDGSEGLWDRIARVSRNVLEEMAYAAREDGIYVYTLGLGSSLTAGEGPDYEQGEDMLKLMANDSDILNDSILDDYFVSDQPQGVYCYAVDEQALGPCFNEIVEEIIRLTR